MVPLIHLSLYQFFLLILVSASPMPILPGWTRHDQSPNSSGSLNKRLFGINLDIIKLPFYKLVNALGYNNSDDPYKIPRQTGPVCNGYSDLCGRGYGNITHIGAHNSYTTAVNPLVVAANQNVDVIEQLNRGVRLLQGGVHWHDGRAKFCHRNCYVYDGGSLKDYLIRVRKWMESHPTDVITMILCNVSGIDMLKFHEQFQASNMQDFAYIPPSKGHARHEWPTLGSLISNGKRLIVFIDSGADRTVINYLLPQFDNMWETPFSVRDKAFPCKVDRGGDDPNTGRKASGKMYMINHSYNTILFGKPDIFIPARFSATETNSVDSIIKHANECATLVDKRWPNFILLDWVDKGNPFEARRILNRL